MSGTNFFEAEPSPPGHMDRCPNCGDPLCRDWTCKSNVCVERQRRRRKKEIKEILDKAFRGSSQ